jgi:predicted site-specific integrase-resolvase
MKKIKLSTYAKNNNLCYRTAYNYYNSGILKGEQLETGTILVYEEEKVNLKNEKIAIYCRESTIENQVSLDNQEKRISDYCAAKGWTISKIVKEIGSGINDKRPKFLSLLSDISITKIVVEHNDRFCRFGIEPIKRLLKLQNRELIVINETNSEKEDLIQDFVSIITSFCARIYGQRRTKKATEKLIKELNATCRNT